MALSEQEQQMLDEIERALIAEDPRLAQQARKNGSSGFHLNIRSLVLIIVGLAALVGGIVAAQHSLWFVALSVLGFFMMFTGGVVGFYGHGGVGRPSVKREVMRVNSTKAQKRRRPGGLGDKMEDNFRRRFEH